MNITPENSFAIGKEFVRYTSILFVLFATFGAVYCLVYGFSLMALVLNPLIYSIGITIVILVIAHDIDDILSLVGLGKKPRLSLHIKYAKEIQDIAMLMSMGRFANALKKANALVKAEPGFAEAHNLRGEILMRGFQRHEEARRCFDEALALSKKGDEPHRIASVLKSETFR